MLFPFCQVDFWVTSVLLVKYTLWRTTNGFPVLVRITFFKNEKIKKKLTGHTLLPVGQENPSKECTDGDVPNAFLGERSDHDGPYDGVSMDIC